VEKRTGIYICNGCQIEKSIDIEGLCSGMNEELKPSVLQSHTALCSPDGVSLIQKGITENGLSGCVIAACGKGVKDDVFDLGEDVLIERVNLRELVAWSMEPNAEDTQMAAEDYLRMGFAGLNSTSTTKPFILDTISEEILVVGGGISGITAALEGADAGYKIHLVERADALGGWTAKWHKQIPFHEPFDKLRDTDVAQKIKLLEENDLITIYLNSEIKKIDGQPGEFTVKLNDLSIQVGSIVTAAGWRPYKPESKEFYGYGVITNVITSVELEEKVTAGALPKIDAVLFLQCAGSRDENHLPYCSSVCCGITLKQAKYYREQYPDTIIYILYKDIRTPGFLEEFYREVQDDSNIIFIKGDFESIQSADDRITVSIKDKLLGEQVSVEVGQVVLATGMVPNGTEDLKLGYRLGAGLPELKYDFPDSHFICFPYETRRTGIYAAGAVRAPLDIPSSMDDAGGAMMKAIQTIEATKRGEAVHPRSGDQSYPELYLERCTDCKRCTEECPFGTYDETASGTPVVHPNRCRRCGICLGSCPERVISFSDYSINIISEKIKSVNIPDEFDEKPRVLVFVCENDAMPALEMAGRDKMQISPYVRIIPVRCLGSINRVWISDALSHGFDGILQIGCKPGDNYQCHFIHGSELTEQRSEIMEETLSTMMLEPERIMTNFVEITDHKGIIEHIDNYMEEIDLIGPNPFKDI
jgi:quinone-modifying oxidoreductase, subunit QmoB